MMGSLPVSLYDYRPSRSGDHPEEYLEGFKGYLHSDGYAGYNKLTDVIRCGCLAHLRRGYPRKESEGYSANQCRDRKGLL